MMKTKNRTPDKSYNRMLAVGSALSVIPVFTVTSFADGDVDARVINLVEAIMDVMTNIARWVGVLLLVFGIYMFVSGMRNEDIENKHRASILLLVGITLILIRYLLNSLDIWNTILPS